MIKRHGLVSLALFVLLAAASGCATASKAATFKAPANTLSAVKVTGAFTIDGNSSEPAWSKATAVMIPLKAEAGVEAKKVTLRAVYDDKNIYVAAAYADATPLKLGEAWTFDGAAWKKGSFDDTLAFVWNINDSIPGFNQRGMGVMTKPLTKGMDVFDFQLAASDNKTAAAKADFWGWCGMPEFYGRGDDMIFALDEQTKLGGLTKTLTVRHDAHTNSTPWIRNEATVNGSAVPKYKYKAGFDINNTPRPYEDQVEAITDYSTFKAGDRAPYVVGIRGATWGGSKDDIRTKGRRSAGDWQVEYARALDTGHADDIKLVPGETVTFIVVLRDDAKGYAISAPVTLRLGEGG